MKPLVFQTDFGLADGAVSAMYGVALKIDQNLKIYDLTHEIEPYNIWEAGYRLLQTVDYWSDGTVFVSVVDPGVGMSRRSVCAKLISGQLVVTPDNGTLTFLKKRNMIAGVRVIDEARNRLAGSEKSYTFYGRDVYAYTGARLASEEIAFEDLGEPADIDSVVELPTSDPVYKEGIISGSIDVLDIRFGSLWTNISKEMFSRLNVEYGDDIEVAVSNDTRVVYRNTIQYQKSFAGVYVGEALVYVNSLNCMAVAINQGSFAKAYNVGAGNNWHIVFKRK